MNSMKRPKFNVILAFFVGVFLLLYEASASKAFPIYRQQANWPPPGKSVRLPVTRDTWVSSIGNEKIGNNGGASRLKLKGSQEYTLIDFDTHFLKGKINTGALIHLCSASPAKSPLGRLGVSTVAAEWIEGTSTRYNPEFGSSCFEQASYRTKDWAYEGSSLMDVVYGRGHTVWKFAECSQPDKNGWQVCAIDPDVVAANVAGISHGFCLYDEIGNTWSIKKGKLNYTYFPNRFFHSRKSERKAPWLEVWTDGTDTIPPEPLTSISVTTRGLPGGEAILEWKTPPDKGGGKTFGFHGECVAGSQTKPIPRYLIPIAGQAGQRVRMHLQDLSLRPGQEISVSIKPVDSAGNIGAPYSQKIRVASETQFPEISPIDNFIYDTKTTEFPKIGGSQVMVIDPLYKINPLNGESIPPINKEKTGASHLYSAEGRKIHLYAARNETVYFQLNLVGSAENVTIDFSFDNHSSIKTKLYQFGYVNVREEKSKQLYPLPDPLLPIVGRLPVPSKAGAVSVDDQKNHSLFFEIYVPHNESPNMKHGTVQIGVGKEVLTLNIELNVWNFTLPNKLSFVPEMNCYGGVFPNEKGYEYYRLAHEHRTCLNRLPYNWGGRPSFAPDWDGNQFYWESWDQKVAPLLDGSLFKDLPRSGEPVDCFYLPFNENWPVNLFENYFCSYWADEAFTDAYRTELLDAFAKFAKHCQNRNWHDTNFQFYLNNKIYFRKNYQKSSAPWLFDEPVNTQDFWALRWYGRLWQEAIAPFRQDTALWFRADISYSQHARNLLWGVMDVEYTGGNNFQKIRMKHDEWRMWEKSHYFEYGSANKIEEANTQSVLWCLSAWSNGAIGVLPWQSIGNEKSWVEADQNALFYPHQNGPMPSMRLKAFTYGQQLVEYLTLFMKSYDLPRHAVENWLKTRLPLNGQVHKRSASDAGMINFEAITPADLHALRIQLGEMISAKAPPYHRALVDFTEGIPVKRKAPDLGYVKPAPKVESMKPVCDRF